MTQYSPDGRWVWNGTTWVPVPQQQPWARRSVPCATNTGCLIVIGLVIFLAIVGIALGGR